MWKSISVIILMNGLKIQWGQEYTGSPAERILRTINFTVNYTQKPVVVIHPTEIDDGSTNALSVPYGNMYYGAINAISINNFTYRGYKISWFAIGF